MSYIEYEWKCFQGVTLVTFRNSSCGKVRFLQACVKNSVHGGGGVSQHALGEGCVSQHALGKGCVSQDALGRGVCVSKYAPPCPVHAGIHTPPGQTPPSWADTPSGRPPSRADTRGRHPPPNGHCSGRYAYYWNALLFENSNTFPSLSFK